MARPPVGVLRAPRQRSGYIDALPPWPFLSPEDEADDEDAGSVAGSDHCLLSEAERSSSDRTEPPHWPAGTAGEH